MPFLNYGSVKGLSHQHDFQKDIDRLYDQQRYATEVRREKEGKARYYGEMLQKQQATTPYNTRRLESYYDELSTELADFVVSNPNFETDINLQREFQGISQRFQDNDIIREDAQVAQAYEELRKQHAAGNMTQGMMEKEMEDYLRYSETGGDPYVFKNFSQVDFIGMSTQIASSLQPEIKSVLVNGQVRTTSVYDPKQINGLVKSFLSVEENALAAEKAYKNVEASGLYDSPEDHLRQTVENQLNSKDVHAGWSPLFGLAEKAALKKQMEVADINPVFTSQYTEPLFSKGRVAANINHITLSPWQEKGAYHNPWIQRGGVTGKPKVKVLNPSFDASNPTLNPQYVDMPNFNMGFTALNGGESFLDANGIPWVEVEVTAPLNNNPGLIDKFKGLGWQVRSYTAEGILPAAFRDIEGAKLSSDFVTGTIVVPANVNQANVLKYEQESTSAAIGTKTIPYNQQQVQIFEKQQAAQEMQDLSTLTQRINAETNKKFGKMFPWTKATDAATGKDILMSEYDDDNWIVYSFGQGVGLVPKK